MLIQILFASSIILLFAVPGYSDPMQNSVSQELREKYDGYGEDWIFMPDGNGQPQVAVLKGGQADVRNFFDEPPITYILYTRDGHENGTKLRINKTAALKKSKFSAARPTKFITHGWKSSASSEGFRNMKDEKLGGQAPSDKLCIYDSIAYLAQGDYNIFLVDWEPLAASTFYLGPMANTGKVGKHAANFIDYLVREGGLKTKDVHFIGHSLGAHVAGNVGHQITSGTIGRVTGLDPALPGVHLFSSLETRLDPTDAIFVDIIHSCGGVLGYFQPLGHADFYPNGGTAVQPGCCCVLELLEGCSHGRSYEYFTESINSGMGFPATKCSDWDNFLGKNCTDSDIAYMGAHADSSLNGTYFLRTRDEKPYAYVAEVDGNEV